MRNSRNGQFMVLGSVQAILPRCAETFLGRDGENPAVIQYYMISALSVSIQH
jgi:hypothetical protein